MRCKSFRLPPFFAVVACRSMALPFIYRVRKMEVPSGQYRNHRGLLYPLALLGAVGRFRIYPPRGR